MDDKTKALQKHWHYIFALGTVSLALGTLAILAPFISAVTFEVAIGSIFILGGLAHAIYSFWAREWGGFLFELFGGILYLLIGLTLWANPGVGVLFVALLLAILLVMQGVVQIVLSFELRPMFSWSWIFISGIMSVLLGGFIWVPWPGSSFWLIGLFVAISLLFRGWSMLILGLSTRYPGEHEPITAGFAVKRPVANPILP